VFDALDLCKERLELVTSKEAGPTNGVSGDSIQLEFLVLAGGNQEAPTGTGCVLQPGDLTGPFTTKQASNGQCMDGPGGQMRD
jgi:hypothetical protein